MTPKCLMCFATEDDRDSDRFGETYKFALRGRTHRSPTPGRAAAGGYQRRRRSLPLITVINK